MSINEMSAKQFRELPALDWKHDLEVYDSLVILPGLKKDMHDSGYRMMEFVAVKDNEPLGRIVGGSDVIHFDGIGGYGKNWIDIYGTVPKAIPPSGWSIDCLPASGLLRIFPSSHRMSSAPPLSSFEIFKEAE